VAFSTFISEREGRGEEEEGEEEEREVKEREMRDSLE